MSNEDTVTGAVIPYVLRQSEQIRITRNNVAGSANERRLEQRVIVGIGASHRLVRDWDNIGVRAEKHNEAFNVPARDTEFVKNACHLVDEFSARHDTNMASFESVED